MQAPIEPLALGEMAQRLAAALVVGAAVGLERELWRHAAGLRTMMLVALGSATFVLSGREMLAVLTRHIGPDPQALSEMSRVIQGVIGGVGFLGAGAIIHGSGGVKGLTTAASIWVTASLGIACALGLYRLALLATLCALFTLAILGLTEHRITEHLDRQKAAKPGGLSGPAPPP